MLESLQTKIQHLNGEPLYAIWGQYFLKSREIPRDLTKQYPQLEPYVNLIKFKAIDKNQFRNELKKIETKNDIAPKLAAIFELEKPLDPQDFILFHKAIGLSMAKSSKKHFKIIFCACLRSFIKITYQINNIIDRTLKDPSQEIIAKNLSTISTFFGQYENKYFDDFIIVLQNFFQALQLRIPTIFADNVTNSMKSAWFMLISSIVTFSRVEFKLHPDQPSKTITFIAENLGQIFSKMSPQYWDAGFCSNLTMVFSIFVSDLNSYTAKQIEFISCNAVFPLRTLGQNRTLQNSDLHKLGCVCLATFEQCIKSGKLDKEFFKFQFPEVISFIKWEIANFSSKLNGGEKVELKNFEDPQQLGPISLNEYFSHMDTILYKEQKISNELNDVSNYVKAIINLFDDQIPFLSQLANSLQTIEENITTPTSPPNSLTFSEENAKTFIIFIAQILFSFKEQDLALIFKESWSILLKPSIFPINDNAGYDRLLTDSGLLIMLRCFLYEESSRAKVLDQIADYAIAHGEIVFRYFFDLLNSLLVTGENSCFGPTFSHSKLLKIIIQLSRKRLIYFDFLRHFIFKNTRAAFGSSEVSQFLCEAFMDEKRHDSAFKLIDMGLMQGEEAANSVMTLVQGITVIISRMLQAKSDRVIELCTLITTSIPNLPDAVLSKMSQTFDVCSQIAVVFPDQMNMIIQLFVQASKISPAAFDALLSPDCKIYFNLSNAMEYNKNDDRTIPLLLSLATVDSHLFVNPRALELVFSRASTSPNENQILKKISDMCDNSEENVFMMCMANAPEHIMKRLENVKDQATKDGLICLYLKVCGSSYSASAFFSTVRVLRRPTFELPHVILATIYQLIKTQKIESSPPSYFHFTGKGTGIFGPTANLGDSFSFITSFKLGDSKQGNGGPLVTFHLSKINGICILLSENKLKIQSLDLKKSINLPFKYTFSGDWYSIMVIFKQNTFSLYIDDSLDSTVTVPGAPLSFEKSEIIIGSFTSSARNVGLSAEMGPTFIIKSTEVSQLLPIKDSVPASLSSLVIASYLPSNATNGNEITEINSTTPSVSFRGRSCSASKSVVSVLASPSVAQNVIPLFTRLKGCEKCIGNYAYCNECGALNQSDGYDYLICLLDIFVNLFKFSTSFNNLFLGMNGAQLFVQYLSQIKPGYFDNQFIQKLLEMFDSVQIPKLAVKMAESIWMNFDFMSYLPEDKQKVFITTTTVAFEHNKSAFLDISSVERVLYKFLNETNNSEIKELLWQFLTKLIAESNSKQLLSVFFSIPYANISVPLTESILRMVMLLVGRKNETMANILKDFSYFQPFIPLMAIPDSKIQTLSLQCIMQLNKYTNESLADVMIQCAVAFNSSSDGNDDKFFEQIGKCMKENVDILPLWTTVCRRMKNPISHLNSLDLTQFLNVPLWFYWIFTVSPLDAQKMLSLIKNEDIYILFDFFEVYHNETEVDLSGLKKSILMFLVKNSINEQNLKMAFRYLFFTKNQVFTKSLNSLENYLSKKLMLFSPKANCISFFHLNVDKNTGKWVDLDIAKEIVSRIIPDSSFDVQFNSNIKIHSFVIFAYITYTIGIFEGKDSLKVEEVFSPLLEKADIVSAHLAASILTVQWDLPFLKPYLEIYTDEEDSPQFQLFKFEDKLCKSLSKNSFVQLLSETINKALVTTITPKEPDDDISLSAFCTYSNPEVYKPIIDIFGQFKENQFKRIENERYINRRLLNHFETKLQIGCGPWALGTDQIKFVMLNLVSKTGIHNLMKIDIKTPFKTLSKVDTTVYPAKNIDIPFGENEGDISFAEDSLMNFVGKDSPKITIKTADVAFIFLRQFPSSSIEIFTNNNHNYTFSFSTDAVKAAFLKQIEAILKTKEKTNISVINSQNINNKSKFEIFSQLINANNGQIQKVTNTELYCKMKLLEKWQDNKISNYEYIYYLNILAGRSFNTIEQYPIFPAINGYAPAINFADPKFFGFYPRFQQSTPEIICATLVRVNPFSVRYTSYKSSRPLKDVGEITVGFPELFCFPTFLMNENHFTTIEDVKLPPWARDSYHYVAKLRCALESDFVSATLPKWLDLAFSSYHIFASPHQNRNKKPVLQNMFVDQNLSCQIMRVRKQIAICSNNVGADARAPNYKKFEIPSDVQGSMLAVSRQRGLVLFGTKKSDSVKLLEINSKRTITITQKSIITCATIVGNRYVITGTSDCRLHIYSIIPSTPNTTPNTSSNTIANATSNANTNSNTSGNTNANGISDLQEVSTTTFHNEPIICVAGNAELGLVVSVDRQFNIVFETLLNETFIRSASLEDAQMSKLTPFLDVFRSGFVVCVQPGDASSRCVLFDPRGRSVAEREIAGKVVETDKMILNFADEYLVVGVENVGIKIVEIAGFSIVKEVPVREFSGRFAVIPKLRALVVCERNALRVMKL